MKLVLFLLAALMVAPMMAPAPVYALQPDEILDDPELEARAREVSKDLRCVVCQNQSIDDSDAGIAQKMRVLVRERIVAGDTNQEVKDFLVDRYGDFVLLKPPFKAKTMVLWFGPAVIFLLGLAGVVMVFRSKTRAAAAGGHNAPLSAAEQARLNELLKDD